MRGEEPFFVINIIFIISSYYKKFLLLAYSFIEDKFLDKKVSYVVQLLIRQIEFILYPLPKDQSNIKMEVSMAEVVANTGVSKDKGYLYYLGKDGNVWRSQMARAGKGGGNAEKVADAGVTRESGYLYFIDKNGNVARSPMARGRK